MKEVECEFCKAENLVENNVIMWCCYCGHINYLNEVEKDEC